MAQLFRGAQAGDRRCLDRLMRQHDGLVHHVIRQQWDGSLTYAPVLQEGRIALWRAILGFDPQRSTPFSTYASVAIARQVWRAVDRAQEERKDDLAFLFPSPVPRPGDLLPRREIGEALQALLMRLPTRQRWIVRAYCGLDGRGGRTLADIGRQRGRTRQAVHYHLRRALLHLRHPAFSAPLRASLDRDRRQDYLQALGQGRRPR